MHDLTKPVAAFLKTTERLLVVSLEGITDEQSRQRMNDHTNPAVFIAGHMVSSRYTVAQLIGLDVGEPFDGRCNRGVAMQDAGVYPSLAESLKMWTEICNQVKGKLEAVTEAELMADSPYSFPTSDNNVRGGLIFLAGHDMFHLGQLTMLRKFFGLKGIAG